MDSSTGVYGLTTSVSRYGEKIFFIYDTLQSIPLCPFKTG